MPRLACIIPVVGSTEGLETTLLSVLERRGDDCEILVVANVPYDDPYSLQGEIQILQAPSSAGLVECVNLGIAATQSPIVHILANGLQACDGWTERALPHFENPLIAAVTPIIFDAADQQRILATGVRCGHDGRKVICRHDSVEPQPERQSIGPLLQAGFYRKSALAAIGGIPTAVGDELADIDLALTLHKTGWQSQLEPQCRILAADINESTPAAFSFGLWSERFFWRHLNERGWLKSLLMHPFAVLADVISFKPWKAPAQLRGRLSAIFQWAHYREYQRLLRDCISAREIAVAEQRESESAVAQKSQTAIHPHRRIDSAHATTHTSDTRKRQSAKSRKAGI